MTTLADRVHAADPPRNSTSGWFRAFWRWHFYASFLVLPVLLMLAVTGLIYLLRFQIEPAMHPSLMRVEQPAGTDHADPAQPNSSPDPNPGLIPEPYARQLKAVQVAYPQLLIKSMTEPSAPGRSTVFSGITKDGSSRDVFVNPWTAEVLGNLNPDHTLSGLAIRLHGNLMLGPCGGYVIELAACWALVMAVTGYLLFLQGRRARLRRLAVRASGAVLRQRHSWFGVIAGIGLLGMVLTGLPWTGFWGAQVQNWVSGHGTSLWSRDPGAVSNPASTLDESLPHSHRSDVPWGLGKTGVPHSSPPGPGSPAADGTVQIPGRDGAIAQPMNLDGAIDAGRGAGLVDPLTITLPAGENGTYSAIGYAFHDPAQERTVHVDRFSGHVISAYGYADYPELAKAVSQGIALHEGRRFGVANFWLSLSFCVAVIALCLTGPLMWWRRRPTGGGLSAPRGRLPIRQTWWLAPILLALGIFLPLFGASLVIVLLVDQFALRRIGRLRHAFAVVD